MEELSKEVRLLRELLEKRDANKYKARLTRMMTITHLFDYLGYTPIERYADAKITIGDKDVIIENELIDNSDVDFVMIPMCLRV